MVSADNQKALCPVCRRSDKVKRLQAVYNEGMARFAPPPMPTKTVSVLRYMLTGMLVVGICVFLIIVFVGSESFGQDFSWLELALVSVTLIGIVLALVLSYIAFTKVVKGDMEAQKHYSEWDVALARWEGLRYCSRDDVVFDPQTNKTISEEELSSLVKNEGQQVQATSGLPAH